MRIAFDRFEDILLNQWFRSLRSWAKLFFRYKIMPLFQRVAPTNR